MKRLATTCHSILTGSKIAKGYIFCSGADLKQMSVDPGGMMTERGGFAAS